MDEITLSEFHFVVPPEAPIFEPNEDEFCEPLVYIEKIRPIAEKIGICKIKPPKNWRPPFALDVENLRFTPRVQCLNLLEAKTRIKINFLTQLATFWEMQGVTWKIPRFDKVVLDLYSLYQLVEENGGFKSVCVQDKWAIITKQLGICEKYAKSVQYNYKKLLKPYDTFCKTQNKDDNNNNSSDIIRTECNGNLYLYDKVPNEDNLNDVCNNDELDLTTFCKELRRLRFYGAGPKMAGYSTSVSSARNRRTVQSNSAKYFCVKCTKSNYDEPLHVCSNCDNNYHAVCLPLKFNKAFSSEEWFCPNCVKIEMNKAMEAFGFPQADKEYNLHEFGVMADLFKMNHFNTPLNLLTTRMIEKEYWRIMNSFDEKVTVEYGADLHTVDHGSGFPTINSNNLDKEDRKYVESKWNLNNLPVINGSILNYVSGDISGIKLPWMYVGMVFSTFCWHIEDHWTYSINYLHWGEPKTWYGVPGHYAEQFEHRMKQYAPELFRSQPDLLHQLVTTMNPNVLMDSNIPVFRTDQQAGEFVITFPRAYHAGFNQGYNFAEAVNFAPPEWLNMGRHCVNHYSHLRRICVFSHDELVCRMATLANELNPIIATVTYNDAIRMIEEERMLRKMLHELGVHKAMFILFEKISDDERQCSVCNTTCFLSALTCECSKNTQRLVCLHHYKLLCDQCPIKDFTLCYRYLLDEFKDMLINLRAQIESFDTWLRETELVLKLTEQKPTLEQLKKLYNKAIENNLPQHPLLALLEERIQAAEKCQNIIMLIFNEGLESTKLSFNELLALDEEIDNIHCKIENSFLIKRMCKVGNFFLDDVKKKCFLETDDWNEKYLQSLEKYIHFISLDIDNLLKITDIPIKKDLEVRIEQVKWYINTSLQMEGKLINMNYLEKIIKSGLSLEYHPKIEKRLKLLQKMLTRAQNWETNTKNCLSSTSVKCLYVMKPLIDEATSIQVDLPTRHILEDTFKLLSNWICFFKDLNQIDYDALQAIIRQGNNLPMRLKIIENLQNRICLIDEWKIKLIDAFLLSDAKCSVMDVLCPRTFKYLKQDQSIFDVFCLAACEEFRSMKLRQILNFQKINNNEILCFCGRPNFDVMIKCSLCFSLYHLNHCVQLPDSISSYFSSVGYTNNNLKEFQWFCSFCSRSKRPTINTILDLMRQYIEIGVSLDVGHALKCLAGRFCNWFEYVTKLSNSTAMEQWNYILAHSYLQNYSNKNQSVAEKLQDLVLEYYLMEIGSDDTVLKIIKLIYQFEPETEFFKTFFHFESNSFILITP